MITVFQNLGPLAGILFVLALAVVAAALLMLLGCVLQNYAEDIDLILERVINKHKKKESSDWLEEIWEDGNHYE